MAGLLPTLTLGGITLPTYTLYFSLLLTLMVLWVQRRAYKLDFSPATALDLFLAVTAGGAIGARLIHVIYEEPAHYLAHPWEVLYIWQGGFVFYGGVIGGFLGGWLALKYIEQSFSMWLDFFTPVVSLGYALGRLGCLLSGCCYGHLCPWPWALEGRHPTQIYASFSELAIFGLLMMFEKNRTFSKTPGRLFYIWLALHALSRIGMEYFRADNRGPLVGPVSISTAISLIFIAVALPKALKGKI